jgi:hypothetical protein
MPHSDEIPHCNEMSRWANKRLMHLQQMTRLFNHLVRAGEEARRNLHGEGFRGLEVDNQTELGGLFNGDVAGFFTLEKFVRKSGGAVKHVGKLHSVSWVEPLYRHFRNLEASDLSAP